MSATSEQITYCCERLAKECGETQAFMGAGQRGEGEGASNEDAEGSCAVKTLTAH